MENEILTPAWWTASRISAEKSRDTWGCFVLRDIDAGNDKRLAESYGAMVRAAERMSICEQYDGHGDGSLDG